MKRMMRMVRMVRAKRVGMVSEEVGGLVVMVVRVVGRRREETADS